jgi:pimeloyl-ACP methyl ester carboxylesterase
MPFADVIVLLPGILGSVLRKNGKDVWGLSAGVFSRALWHLGNNIQELAIPEGEVDSNTYDDGVSAPELLPDTTIIPWFWKIDGYTLIRETLQNGFDLRPGQNFFAFPYDWRRDNRLAAQRLKEESDKWLADWRRASGNKDARLILVAHSMGGLVARYFLEVLEGWRDTRLLITFGTPYRGSLNALNFIANGFAKKIGPLKLIDLSKMLRSFTSVYQLLPIYRCYDQGDGDYKYLTDVKGIPNLDPARAARAFEFHNEIKAAVERHKDDDEYKNKGYRTHPVVGTFQPTLQSAVWTGQEVAVLQEFKGRDEGGDGTVPRVSATPIELSTAHNEVFAAGQHASLQNAASVLAHLRGLLGDIGIDLEHYKALGTTRRIGVEIDDAFYASEPVSLRARSESGADLYAAITNVETGLESAPALLKQGIGEWQSVEFPPMPEGTYRVTVRDAENKSEPVSDIFLVMED